MTTTFSGIRRIEKKNNFEVGVKWPLKKKRKRRKDVNLWGKNK